MRSYLLCVSTAALLLAGCSKAPRDQFSLELAVDGSSVIKESAEGDKGQKVAAQHRELMAAVELACQYARFALEKLASKTTTTAMPADLKGKPADLKEILELTSLAEGNYSVIPPAGSIVVCQADGPTGPGCDVKFGSSDQQRPYGLELKTLLQAKYGLKSEAAYLYKTKVHAVDGKSTIESTDAVSIKQDRYACSSTVVTEE